MYKILSILFLSLFSFIYIHTLSAQATFTDNKPEYRQWQDSYILDKIEYTKDRTIFYFRFVSLADPNSPITTDAVFYPRGGAHPWYLKAKNSNKTFELLEIRNVKRNNELVASKVVGELRSTAFKYKNTVFSCEIHFPRLPNDIEFADLIEGRGQERNRNHFNCFNIKLKTEKSKDLGTKEDSEKTVQKFNKQFNVDIKEEPKKEEPKKEEPKKEEPKKEEPKVIANTTSNTPNNLRNKSDIACGNSLIMDKIKFKDDSDEFMAQADAHRQMLILLDFLTQNSNATIKIQGHTDIFGNPEKNLELSRARARKVQIWFTMNGVNPKRVDIEWFGGTKPLKPEGDAINRRVEIEVACK